MILLLATLLQATTLAPQSANIPSAGVAAATVSGAATAEHVAKNKFPSAPIFYSGQKRELDVNIPRLHANSISVDGMLNETEWQQAAVLTSFTSYHPVDARPAQDSIEIRLWYAEDAIFVGIRAWAVPGTVRATLAERDKILNDDWVAIQFDTFNDRRRAFTFAVNALGVQADGMRSEQSSPPGTSRASLGVIDLSQDYIWQSAGRLLDDGFEAEMRIPFKSIRFQLGNEQDWGLQVIRQTQRTGFQDLWAPTSRSIQTFLGQSGYLRKLSGMKRGLVLDVAPTTTVLASGTPSSGNSWQYGTRGQVGGDVRWGATANFTVNFTANPDFSQVETDVGQIPGDVRFALSYPELRPFFVEGSEQFDVPNQLVYTRRLVQPVGAVKITGKIPDTEFGLLSAMDAARTGLDGRTHPLYNILRVRRDIGTQSVAGLLYTDRIEGARYNRVGGADSRIQFANVYNVELRAAYSTTHDRAGTRTGQLMELNTGRSGRTWGYRGSIQSLSPHFETQSGFVNRTDFVRAQIFQRITRFGKSGGWWDQQQQFLRTSAIWSYDGFGRKDVPLETSIALDNSIVLHGGWKLSVNPELQSVAFDARRYARLATLSPVGNGVDTVAFKTGDRPLTGYVNISVNTPQWRRAGLTLTARVGGEPEFFETSTARRTDFELSADLRPTSQLRLTPLLRYQRFTRSRDGSVFSTQVVPRLRTEYQFSRALLARVIMQVESRERDALRDPFTELPLYSRSTSGALVLAGVRRSLLGRADVLLSYLPSPGTVVYVGYGSAVDASADSRLSNAERTSDGAFIKLSYLFRVGVPRQ